ncbi:MAG: helix-turn-helix domain-containing protein [Emergencia sp.]
MTIADKIAAERKRRGWSQEELAEKLGVSRQAVSKWESAGSVPDLQKIIQMSELFDVSTDYLLKDNSESEMTAIPKDTYASEAQGISKPARTVSRAEAEAFLDMKKKTAPAIANATAMCIISPVLLILLGTMSEEHILGVTEAFGAGAGLVFLFVMIAIAVAMFITSGVRSGHMEHLEKENFELEDSTAAMVKKMKNCYEEKFARTMAVGVVLCILSVVPLIIAGIMEAPDYICGALTSLLLILIAAGVNIMIRVGSIKNSYDTLLEEGEFTREEKKIRRKTSALNSAYWCLATAVYLGWSFWTMKWHITWIVWPVAGVLFVAYSAFTRFLCNRK